MEVTRPKVVLVGGGSYGWSPTLIKDLLLKAGLEQVDYCLLDINLEAAEMLRAYGEKANGKFGTDCRFTATTVEDEAFDGAGYVVITISTGGLEAMRHDLQIPESYRIYHTVGDTCGPGGWARAVRNIPVFVEMARKIERLSPEAVVLNYTNPLAVLTGAVCRTTSARGNSSVFRSPKTCKNRFVVPYKKGRPNSSERPAIRTSSRSISCRRISPHCTPRTASTSARSTG